MGPTAASNRAAGTTPASSQSAASAGPLFSTTPFFNTTSTTTTGLTSTNTATFNTPSGPANTLPLPLARAPSTQSRPRPATSAGEASRTARPASSFSSYSSTSSSSLLLYREPPSIPPPPLPTLPAVPPLPPTTGSNNGDRHKPNVLTKERRPSLSKKPSFTRSRGSTTSKDSASTSTNANGSGSSGVSSIFHHQRHKSASSIAFGSGSSHSTGSPKKGSTESNTTTDTRPPPLPSDWATATASAAQRISVSPNIQVVPPSSSPTTTSPVKNWSTFTSATSSSSTTSATTVVPTTPLTASFTPNFSHPNHNNSHNSNNKMLGAVLATPATTGLAMPIPTPSGLLHSGPGTAAENAPLLNHIQEMVNKRISTLDYLRKAHDGRVYWFNTLRFDRPDLNRMSYFDTRRLARRATNYLLLGLSLPAVVDLNSANVIELLRSLGALLAEFESFQQLHSETGSGSSAASSLSRAARLPNMFRRATPGSKVRRTSSSAASGSNDFTSSFDGGMSGGANGGMNGMGGPPGSVGGSSMVPPSSSGGLSSSGGGGLAESMGGSPLTLVNSESAGSVNGGGGSGGGGGAGSSSFGNGVPPLPSGAAGLASNHNHSLGGLSGGLGTSSMTGSVASTAFATYYDNNTDLLPGEEYTFLLTPSLPFDPDFFETFSTLCDVLIDSYQRILSLMPTPRECSPLVVELFGKADARVRKLLVQGVVKEFEDHSRGGVKMEVANVGKVVLGGLM